MADKSDLLSADNFFGELKTESCVCGHKINVTNTTEHTCDQNCQCSICRQTIKRQLGVIEED